MNQSTKFLLDSGDPDEYKEIVKIAKDNGSEIWGATTNPSLIAKKLAGKKITQKEAFQLQKQIVLEIIELVPGAVSAEVYADQNTLAEEMVTQAREIIKWHKQIIIKLPTNLEGFKARTILRQEKIPINNTLVFSQEQVFAICLHEQIMQTTNKDINVNWPCFISPFVGRLDDIGINGMDLIKNSMQMKQKYNFNIWMLEASVRRIEHIDIGINYNVDIITSPGKFLKEWFEQKSNTESSANQQKLQPIPYWKPSEQLLNIKTIEQFMEALENGKLNIQHNLTDKGIERFVADWKSIILS